MAIYCKLKRKSDFSSNSEEDISLYIEGRPSTFAVNLDNMNAT